MACYGIWLKPASNLQQAISPAQLSDAKQAQAAAPSDAQKQAIQGLIDRLEAKQDINK